MQAATNYRPQAQAASSSPEANEQRDSAQNFRYEAAPQVQSSLTHSQPSMAKQSSHHDQQMGATDLEESPEVRSRYLQPDSRLNNEGRASEEPHTASRHPTNPSQNTLDPDLRGSSRNVNSTAQRPQPIDQSSIIKTQDESAFNNNLQHIFPSGTNGQTHS